MALVPGILGVHQKLVLKTVEKAVCQTCEILVLKVHA